MEKVARGDYQIGNLNWVSWLNDPIWYLEPLKIKGRAYNVSRWEDTRYRNLLDMATETADPIAREALLYQAEALLIEEAPVIPLFNLHFLHLQNPALKGVYFSPFGSIDFKHAYFDE